jgi:hypothetical protein
MIQSLKRPSAIEKYWPLADVWFFSRAAGFLFLHQICSRTACLNNLFGVQEKRTVVSLRCSLHIACWQKTNLNSPRKK